MFFLRIKNVPHWDTSHIFQYGEVRGVNMVVDPQVTTTRSLSYKYCIMRKQQSQISKNPPQRCRNRYGGFLRPCYLTNFITKTNVPGRKKIHAGCVRGVRLGCSSWVFVLGVRLGFQWWAIRDSNPGPTGYEPVALTN